VQPYSLGNVLPHVETGAIQGSCCSLALNRLSQSTKGDALHSRYLVYTWTLMNILYSLVVCLFLNLV